MHAAIRFARLVVACLIVTSTASMLTAGFCVQRQWSLSEIEDAPVLAVVRVVSINGRYWPRFPGEPWASTPEQTMIAELEVLRFFEKPPASPAPIARLSIRFIGRDGLDTSRCPKVLPAIEVGQVLLLPLRHPPANPSEPWQLIGDDGSGLATRVAEVMQEKLPPAGDSHAFLVRELVNSLSHGDPIARFTAALLVVHRDGYYLEPELMDQLERSIGSDGDRWAQVLGNVLLQYPDQNTTIADILAGKSGVNKLYSNPDPLAKLALSHISSSAKAETMVWKAILEDLPGFADEPYHPLFRYEHGPALKPAIRYLAHYSEEPALIEMVKTALRNDRPGSSTIASSLISAGQTACLSEALDRAMKVIAHPEANGSDVFSAITLILDKGSDQQRRQYVALISRVKSTNADYAAFLQLRLKLSQGPQTHLP
jgi:hypothetical protein